MKNATLFVITSLIWGSTWIAIKYQLGSVPPMVSLFYRFGLAAILLFTFCIWKNRQLKFSWLQHRFLVLQGILLFSLNYWLVYLAETELSSGLVALIFSTIIFFNSVFGKVFYGRAIKGNIIFGGILGLIGLGIIFFKDLFPVHIGNENLFLVFLCIISAVLASLGNMVAIKNKNLGIPVIQTNAFGMLYGSVFMLLLVLLSRQPVVYEFSISYTASLIYLSIFGSIVAFSCYFILMNNIGADKAAYITMVFPVVAIAISTLFEAYPWTWQTTAGLLVITAGNYAALRPRKKSEN